MEKDKEIKDIENIDVFEQSDYLTFMLKKAEKIVTAIYLVTNLFPTNDPLKHTLRERSICLLSDINYIRQNFDSTNVRFVFNLDLSISNILSLLNVARDTRLISEMNYSILENEIRNLASNTFNNNKTGISEVVFHDKFFGTDKKLTEDSNAHLGRLNLEISKENKQVGLMSHRSNKLGMSFKIEKTAQNKGISRRIGQKQQEAKEKRRALIINLMKNSKFIMIKDVTKLIKNCSEKTIQRELNSMVIENIIKREGTRRWSKYCLI